MENKVTLVLGASLKPRRYSNMAIQELVDKGQEVVAVGLREGVVSGVPIMKEFPDTSIHTVTMYLGAPRQKPYYAKILEAKPKRVIFNPGAENFEFSLLLKENDIESIEACTLVMLSIGNY